MNDDNVLFNKNLDINQESTDLRNEISNQGFQIYKDDVIGDFTFIEARKTVE